jgi:hypothetical protein
LTARRRSPPAGRPPPTSPPEPPLPPLSPPTTATPRNSLLNPRKSPNPQTPPNPLHLLWSPLRGFSGHNRSLPPAGMWPPGLPLPVPAGGFRRHRR